jgi:hypothetical protein
MLRDSEVTSLTANGRPLVDLIDELARKISQSNSWRQFGNSPVGRPVPGARLYLRLGFSQATNNAESFLNGFRREAVETADTSQP